VLLLVATPRMRCAIVKVTWYDAREESWGGR
jgi:hypothetical protein